MSWDISALLIFVAKTRYWSVGFENPELLQNAVIKTFLDPIDVPQNKYSRMIGLDCIFIIFSGNYFTP